MRRGYLASTFNFLLLATLFTGCSAKVDGAGGGVPVAPQDPRANFSDKVKGTSLQGEWVSSCVSDHWSDSGYAIFDITFSDQNRTLVRKETKYSDANCTHKIEEQDWNGWFRFAAQDASDLFEVDYRIKMPNGTFENGENIRVEGGSIFITDRVMGSAAVPTIELKSVSANAAPVTPTPGNGDPSPDVPASMAKLISDVKYAFCSNRGSAVLIDLSAMNLAQIGSTGSVQIQRRACNSKTAFVPDPAPLTAQVDQMDGELLYVALSTGEEIMISDSYPTGEVHPTVIGAIFGGNNIDCVLIANKNGLGGLPFPLSEKCL